MRLNTLRVSIWCHGSGPGLVTFFWPVLYGYLRIATHPSIFTNPLSPAGAESAIEALLSSRAVRVVGEDDRSWSAYRTLNAGPRPRGNLVPNAVIVSTMVAYGVRTIYTRDRYFRQLDGIEVIDPTS